MEVIPVNKEIKFSTSVKHEEYLENVSSSYFLKKKYSFQVRHAINCGDVTQHSTVIPRLTKIIRSGITSVSRNLR